MRNPATSKTRKYFLGILFAAASLGTVVAGCGSSKPAGQAAPVQTAQVPKKYLLTGRVVSVDKPKMQLVVDGADIPGFMMAMTMPYSVKDAKILDLLSAEDQIKADVIVNDTDTYLENIVVVKKADTGKAAAPANSNPPAAPPEKK